VTAAINGQDKLQLFSCLSKRQERERFFHGCNMFVNARSHVGLKSYMAGTCDQGRVVLSCVGDVDHAIEDCGERKAAENL
jgi:hypothetical protein